MVDVRARFPGAPGRSLLLTAFAQPEALRLGGLRASSDGWPLVVERTLEGGFERWRIAAPPAGAPILVEYAVRPGAEEEARMAGPTGYRLGHLDAAFGLLTGRQIFLFPAEPAAAFRVTFALPDGWDILAPWPHEPAAGDRAVAGAAAFRVEGDAAPSRLLRAVLGAGRFQTSAAHDGPVPAAGSARRPRGTGGLPGFRVHVLASIPVETRVRAAGRALALEDYFAKRLGRPSRAYDLFLVPRAPSGSYVSVAPAPEGFGLSLGDGLATRWLSIGRALGQSYLEERLRGHAADATPRRALDGLPTYLSAQFSQRDRWRWSQVLMEQFYYNSAGIDLADSSSEPTALVREWRATLVLHHLSRAMEREEIGPLGDLLQDAAFRDAFLAWSPFLRRLPDRIRADLDRWTADGPYPFPFPGEDTAGPPRLLPPPPPIPAGKTARRLDLYLGGRNLGLLEQCGCRSRQIGGMARRTALLRRRLAGPVPAVAVEIGDAVPFDQKSPVPGPQTIADSDLALSLLAGAGTAGLNVSHAELAYGPEFLRERAARLPRGFRLFSAGLQVPGLTLPPDLRFPPRPPRPGRPSIRIVGFVERGNYHLGRALEHEDATALVGFADPVQTLRRLTTAPRRGETLAVAGYLSPTTVLRLAREFPGLPLVVTHDYFRFNEDRRVTFERPVEGLATFGMLDGTLVVLLQSDAYGLVRLGLLLRPDGGIEGAELEDLVLDDSIPDDPKVRARLDAHYLRLARESGLADHPPVGGLLAGRLGAPYVGADACAPCHETQTAQWRTTAHAAAFATLLARNRQGVPGCFACHVTGYRQEGGYLAVADRAMRHVQCESCHGPGGRHAAEPRHDNIVRAPPALVCRECHDEKHSDMTEANYPDYRRRTLHSGPPEGTGAGPRTH
ncbi:MAG: multiheme c-type cytochrome [Candidatus Polarisedimenticolia bacterium]